jgi:D-arginine dehydrogenase
LALDRFSQVVNWPVAAVERRWAGLRSFTPDRGPVFGADQDCPGFYWCAGQGGAGIQTAPAISSLLAAEILGVAPLAPYDRIAHAAYAPARFATSVTNGGNG